MFTGGRESAEREKSEYLRKTTLGICGDPVVGWALALLLRGPDYEAIFMPAFMPAHAALGEAQEALKDVRLVVLTPTPELSIERRNALVSSLKELSEAENMPVLELLVAPLEASQEEETGKESWHMVPWPCRIRDLEWRIEAAWARHYGTRGERIGIANKGPLHI
jgi:hypothetical protein